MLEAINIGLLILAVGTVLTTLLDRAYHALAQPSVGQWFTRLRASRKPHTRVRLVHWQTGERIVGVRLTVLAVDGTVAASKRTDSSGLAVLLLPPGVYRLTVADNRFTLAPLAETVELRAEEELYAGEQVTITDQGRQLVFSVQPAAATSLVTPLHRWWRAVEKLGRYLRWPAMIAGLVLNTGLLLRQSAYTYVVFEALYALLVVAVIILELRFRPSVGVVRDALTHVPLDLAVVRLYEHTTNRLVLTRVTDSRGRFFALPPTGVYNLVVTRNGYETFTKEGLTVTAGHGRSLDIQAHLLPLR